MMPHPPHPAALDQDALAALTGYQRAADIEMELTRLGIRFFRGRRGIWTTLDAANRALWVGTAPADRGRIEF